MTTDVCVICGAPIPEGRQVCPECDERAAKKKSPKSAPPKKRGPHKKKRHF